MNMYTDLEKGRNTFMVKKMLHALLVGILVVIMASPTMAASTQGKYSGTPSHSSPTAPQTHNAYKSGPQRPSSQVTNPGSPQNSYHTPQQPAPTYTPPAQSKFGGVGSFLGGMAVGGMLGSMFHPFGGGHSSYDGGFSGFSFSGLIMDILLIAAIVWLFRKFTKRA
jgi:hypothetical protein